MGKKAKEIKPRTCQVCNQEFLLSAKELKDHATRCQIIKDRLNEE